LIYYKIKKLKLKDFSRNDNKDINSQNIMGSIIALQAIQLSKLIITYKIHYPRNIFVSPKASYLGSYTKLDREQSKGGRDFLGIFSGNK
jgi:hypothetical protein